MDKYCQLLLLIFTMCIASCINDPVEPSVGDSPTATVRMVLDARSADLQEGVLEKNEGIKTLRVIIANASGSVIRNELRAVDDMEGSGLTTQQKLIIYGLPTGIALTFYVIANEASFGGDLSTDYGIGKSVAGLTSTLLSSSFPTAEAINFGLPMSGFSEQTTFTKENNEIVINLQRAVAKINLILKNPTSSSITLSGVTLGKFFTSETRLFAGSLVEVSGEYKSFELLTNSKTITIPPQTNVGNDSHIGEVRYCPIYLYETAAGKGVYTLKVIRDDGIINEAKEFINPSGESFSKIDRNSNITLTATIINEATLQVEYKVVSWDERSVEVPPFN